MKKFMTEFKEFAMRGNVMDLAVGVIIGAAFKSIVDSLVTDIISPIIGMLCKGNFDGLKVEFLSVTLTYGKFLTAVINFIIMAFVVFLLMKGINGLSKIGKKEVPAAPTTKVCPFCKSEIDIEATKCPHCTSDQPKVVKKEEPAPQA